ncbi:MAG: hypothetical protein JNL32_05980 [Candidatus Kapabacteria bacterium]|nr:hypothetical protein [Candidatus Kapabacteria bacterium]
MKSGQGIDEHDEALHLALRAVDDDDAFGDSASDALSADALRAAIENAVVSMLTHHPERLMSVLYRIDVDETRINDVMNNAPVGGIATRITGLIIDRMMQKVATRNAYRRAAENTPDEDTSEEQT